MVKDKHIISEIASFFPKNDCNRAINCIISTISRPHRQAEEGEVGQVQP